MIFINADGLQDGLYNVKDGQIFKYKAKGGTVRTYDMGEVVRCRDCVAYEDGVCNCDSLYMNMMGDIVEVDFEPHPNFYCAFAERKEE